MAKAICRVHGPQIGPHVCPHIEEAIYNRKHFSATTCLRTGSPPIVWSHYFCQLCAEQWNLSIVSQEPPESVEMNYRDALETTRPVCGKCFSELRLE